MSPKAIIYSASVFMFVCGRAPAQEMAYLKARLESQLAATDKAAQSLVDFLAAQPAEVREAALEVAQHPELLVGLGKLEGAAPDAVFREVAGLPSRTAGAARVLLANHEVLTKLAEQLPASAILGRVYGAEREGMKEAMARLGAKASEQAQATNEAWTARLTANQDAAGQLRLAAAEAGRVAGKGGLGRAAAMVNERSLPPATLIPIVLAHADLYPELAAAIVDQWERERNPADFRAAVDVWYAKNREVLPWSFIDATDSLPAMLAEHAAFEKEFAQMQATSPNESMSRFNFLQSRQDRYVRLNQVYQDKLVAQARAVRPKVVGAPFTTKGGGGGSSSSSGSSVSSAGSGSRSRSSSSNRSRGNNESMGIFGGRGGQSGRGDSTGGFGNSGGGFNNGSGGFGGGGQGGFGGSSFGGSGGFGSSGGGFGSSSSGFGSSGSSRSSFGSRSNQSSSRSGGQ